MRVASSELKASLAPRGEAAALIDID